MLCEKRPPGAQKVMSTIYQAKLAWMQMCLLSKCLYMQTRSKFAPASTYKQMSGQLIDFLLPIQNIYCPATVVTMRSLKLFSKQNLQCNPLKKIAKKLIISAVVS